MRHPLDRKLVDCSTFYAFVFYFFFFSFQDNQSPTVQNDTIETLATKTKSVTVSKINPEEFNKEADKILNEINNTDSANVPRKIKFRNLGHVDPEAIKNADFEQLVELGRSATDEVILRTSPIKMQVLDKDDPSLVTYGMQLAECSDEVIKNLRLRQITRDPE